MANSISYRVKGLDCVKEVTLLKKAVDSKPGVQELNFQVINGKMTVSYDPTVISPQDIVTAIAATGMSSTPWEQGEATPSDSSWQRHGRLSGLPFFRPC